MEFTLFRILNFINKHPYLSKAIRRDAVEWWVFNQKKEINSSFFYVGICSLKKRRELAELLNAGKYLTVIKKIKDIKC